MIAIKREFYEVEEAANVLGISVIDLWHLIEFEKIGASFRKAIAQATFGGEHLYSMIASHTYLMRSSDACKVAAKGSSLIKYAYLPLLEPIEITIFNGEEEIVFSDTYEFSLNEEIEIQKNDIVITQLSIEKYLAALNVVTNSLKVGGEDVDEAFIGRRERQHQMILNVICKLGYTPLEIPTGGKKVIKDICLKQSQLFTPDGFEHAWKAGAAKGLFKLLDSNKYSPISRGIKRK